MVSFVTVTELRYGAARAGWGELRRRQLERSLADLDVIQTSEVLINRCASLRAEQTRVGNALAQKIHEADRCVAARAVALNLSWWPGTGSSRNVAELDVHRIRLTTSDATAATGRRRP